MFPLIGFFPSGRLSVSRHEGRFVSLKFLAYKPIKRHSSSTLKNKQQRQQEQQEQQDTKTTREVSIMTHDC